MKQKITQSLFIFLVLTSGSLHGMKALQKLREAKKDEKRKRTTGKAGIKRSTSCDDLNLIGFDNPEDKKPANNNNEPIDLRPTLGEESADNPSEKNDTKNIGWPLENTVVHYVPPNGFIIHDPTALEAFRMKYKKYMRTQSIKKKMVKLTAKPTYFEHTGITARKKPAQPKRSMHTNNYQ